jgi:V-type H+-transporting ATPase subunit a
MIYKNLSKCICRDNFIDGEVWILKNEFNTVKQALKDLDKEGIKMPTTFSDVEQISSSKPTHIHTNEFLYPFQEIVNTYGVPAYKEINPAYFNIVTFPFLFGIMFGDIGHGLILFIFGIYLCIAAENANYPKLLKPLIKNRYLLLLMGFFALYCGFIYNEFFSLALPLFGTCYDESATSAFSTFYIPTRKENTCVYPFGFDPAWRNSKNELTFTNSYKMKISVIIGVLHMTFGLLLKGANEIYFNRKVRFVFEFIPQLFFMIGLFGYMILLIFIKWATDWSGKTHYAPSLISQMMNIFLSFGSVVRI